MKRTNIETPKLKTPSPTALLHAETILLMEAERREAKARELTTHPMTLRNSEYYGFYIGGAEECAQEAERQHDVAAKMREVSAYLVALFRAR